LERDGAGWQSEPVEFAVGQNQFGFAPTDMEVGPDGSLYVSVGGRGTRGSVYRIFREDGVPATASRPVAENDLDMVLNALQPNTAWSRAEWVPAARKLMKSELSRAACEEGRPEQQRVRAVEVLVELHGGVDEETVRLLSVSASAVVRARTAWAVGRQNPAAVNADLLRPLLSDADPLVRRLSLEALSGVTATAVWTALLPEIAAALDDENRLVRQSAALRMDRLDAKQLQQLETLTLSSRRGQMWFHVGRLQRRQELSAVGCRVAVEMLESPDSAPADRFDAVRLLQLSISDMGPVKGRPPCLTGMLHVCRSNPLNVI
jgi:hypothetical protein